MGKNVLIVITGIGEPHYTEKLLFLENNLRIIFETKGKYKIDLLVSLYCPDLLFPEEEIRKYVSSFTLVREQNYIGKFIYKYVSPDIIHNYVMLMLDDITLSDNFSFSDIMKKYKHSNENILSPVLSEDSIISHEYMKWKSGEGSGAGDRIVKKCEYMLYIMNMKSYRIYYKIICSYPEHTQYMWGVDLLLSKYGLSSILINNFVVKHHYSHGLCDYSRLCSENMNKLLEKHKNF